MTILGMVADLEKVVNGPKAENIEHYNILKIVGFPKKDEGGGG